MNPQIGKKEIIEAITPLRGWVNPFQLAVIAEAMRGGEGEWFVAKCGELSRTVAQMPATHQTDGQGERAMVWLHYFSAGADWYLIEKDAGAAGDTAEEFQWQAFGVTDMGYAAELGYICIPELLKNHVELDLHFTPRTRGQLRLEREGVAA